MEPREPDGEVRIMDVCIQFKNWKMRLYDEQKKVLLEDAQLCLASQQVFKLRRSKWY